MPRKKVPFISRREAQHYTVVHRSQTDGGYGQEELPSDFVLVPTGANPNHEKSERRGDNSTVNSRVKFGDNDYYEYDEEYNSNRRYSKYEEDNDDNMIRKWRMRNGNKDHITPQGYRNDGYDYDQHFSTGGGGKLVTKDGKIIDNPYQEVIDLPPEALPSAIDLEKANDTMTIDPDLMDPDLKAALFDDADEDGEFELLDDDFVSQAMAAPAKPDFDWDAHMAMLLAKSEERCTGKPARPWGEDSKLIGYEKYLEENDEYGSEIESYDEDDYDEQDYANLSEDQRAKLDADFEKRLAEYDDDNLGYIDEVEEDEIQGTIDLDGDNTLLQSALDEFIEEQKDYHLPQHGFVRNVYEYRKIVPKAQEEENMGPIDVKKEFKEQKLMQQVYEIEKKEIEEREKSGAYSNIATCQEYLREERVQEQWDCETILSTYSTLDNHPSLIKEPTKFKPYKSNHVKNIEANEAASLNLNNIKIGEGKASRIVLKGKYDLPEGYSPYKIVQKKEDKPIGKDKMIAFNSKNIMKANTINQDNARDKHDDNNEGSGGGDDDGDDDYDDDDDDTNMISRMSTMSISRKGETPEEKKIRKAAIKEERRQKRAMKKEVKELYLNESLKQIKVVSKEQKIDNVSVFKYSV